MKTYEHQGTGNSGVFFSIFYCVSDLNSDLLYLYAFVFYLYNSAVKINPLVIVKGSY